MKPKVLVTREGEAGTSQMHLTCICAAERPHMEVRAGLSYRFGAIAMDGMRI